MVSNSSYIKGVSEKTLEVQTDQGVTWRPTRELSPLEAQEVQAQLNGIKSQLGGTIVTRLVSVTTPDNIPGVASGLAAVESPYKTAAGQVVSLVSVSFSNADPNAATYDVYFSGFNGNADPQFVASGNESPISFLCDTTKETVTVTLVSLNDKGHAQSFALAPTTTVVLDGVTSAPPPPSIARSLVRTPLGYNFAFNAEGGLLADVIDGYRIYRNTLNRTSDAVAIQYLKQAATNSGIIEVQDVKELDTDTNYYYWVSAINTSGLESDLTFAGTLVKGAYPQQVTDVTVTESPYKTQSGQLVSLVSVDFTPAVGDAYFVKAQVWFVGYHGNSAPQLMADGYTSPISFLCETTHESVQVCVVAVSGNGIPAENMLTTYEGAPVVWKGSWDATTDYLTGDGIAFTDDKFYVALSAQTNHAPDSYPSDWVTAPIAMVALDGVDSPPPAPSINQEQVGLPNDSGWQFSFNVLGGLLADLIDGYWIYHADSNSVAPVPPANRFQYIKQSATNLGVCTVQEVTGVLQYYWVSAVNINGYESDLTPVPMTYVDPEDPSPPEPAPIIKTISYQPKVNRNGWTHGVHVGDYYAGLGYGDPIEWSLGYGLLDNGGPIVPLGAAFEPEMAIDGNESTYAEAIGTNKKVDFGVVYDFTGVTLPDGATVTAAAIKVLTQTNGVGYYFGGKTSVWTSPDSGSTWAMLYRATSLRFKQYDTKTVTLPQDLTDLQVMCCTESHNDADHKVYQIYLEVTMSIPAGPPKVTGVKATLDGSGKVKLDWNAELVSISNYKVYRTLRGAGYPTAKWKATITSPTTTWTDTTATDDTYEYYVLAFNGGAYSVPSEAAYIGRADNVIYPDGTPVSDLQPTDPGATDGGTIGSNIYDDDGVTLPTSEELMTSKSLRAGYVMTYVPNVAYNSTNTATVDSVDAGTDATIRVYGVGGTSSSWTRYYGLASSVGSDSYSATTFTGKAYDTQYFVAYKPDTVEYLCLTSYANTLPNGYFWVGAVHTVLSGGTGGSSGGGGGTEGGGGGGGRIPVVELMA